MQEDQTVSDMALEVLTRQASTLSKHTEEPPEDALKDVLHTEAGRQLRALSEGVYRDQSAQQWQEDLPRKRAKERKQAQQQEERRQQAQQQEERSKQRLAAWKQFMREEWRELELRKGSQLARMLGESLPGESAAEVLRLATEDRKQAEEGLVALMRDGEVFYKNLEDLSECDVSARIAATRLRKMWLKERQEARWFGRGEADL